MHFEIHGLSSKKADALKAKIKEEIAKTKGVHEDEKKDITIEVYPTQVENFNGHERPYLRFFSGILVRNESEVLRALNKLIDIRSGNKEIYWAKEK